MEVCIFGGFPRSGTRQYADILNGHALMSVKGECFPRVVKLLSRVFEEADDKHQKRWSSQKYDEWRVKSALNAYAGLSKGSNAPYDFSGLKVCGFKSPRVESIYDDLGGLFFKEKIKFFYCVRKVSENYLSECSTFGISVEDYVSSTVSSIKKFFEVVNDERFDCTVLSLDSFLASKNRANYIQDNIFSKFSGVSTSLGEVEELIERTRNINSTESSGKVRRLDLQGYERDYIFNSSELRASCEVMKAHFDVDIFR
ncbi:hypothetical protein [uncultured Gilvimarinus sp.]|uniref:hypothetical protein n=1 Tax=uncultured Gilvimarinus sp. TaxID=1689143 RepID=UPI0030ECAE17|tara:strand:- start:6194 stop:6961 length:768 start_codon:yes stop_codon:yes gene_type:complete